MFTYLKKIAPCTYQSFQYIAVAVALFSGTASAQLAPEPIPNVSTLPKEIPQSWVFAHDNAFFSLTTGRLMLIDLLSENRNFRGVVRASLMGPFQQSLKRGELYVAESFYSRGTRGKQIDVLTIYQTNTLKEKAEVILPDNKRLQAVIQKAALQLTRDENFALVFNFSPASSVTVVDLQKRKVVNEIDTPGCSLVYPLGQRGFATLCADGTALSITLDKSGQVKAKSKSKPFNDIDNDPLFMKAAWHNGTAYFTSYKGKIQPIDLRGNKAKVLRAWDMPHDHMSALPNARPSGWQIISADRNGQLYVLMRANAGEGDHKFGGGAVYVLDAKNKKLADVIVLEMDGFSIEATNSPAPVLAVTNINMELDVYDTANRNKLKTIGGWGASMPLAIYGAK